MLINDQINELTIFQNLVLYSSNEVTGTKNQCLCYYKNAVLKEMTENLIYTIDLYPDTCPIECTWIILTTEILNKLRLTSTTLLIINKA